MSFQFKKLKGFIQVFIFVIPLAGCFHNYFKAPQINVKPAAKAVGDLRQRNRFFILRDGDEAYSMNNIALSNDRKTLDCTLDSLPSEHRLYLSKGRHGVMKYKINKKNEVVVLNEVHFYISSDESTSLGKYTLQLDKVQKIEVIKKDKVRTTLSFALGVFGCGLLLLLWMVHGSAGLA